LIGIEAVSKNVNMQKRKIDIKTLSKAFIIFKPPKILIPTVLL